MSKTDSLIAVSLRISQWAGRRLDKQETAALAAKHNVPTEIGRVHKTLLPMAAPLERLHKLSGAIRTEYYQRTVPWMYDGVNVMKSTDYLPFVTDMRPKLSDWKSLARDFVREYPLLKQQAKMVMNGLYKEEDYPSEQEMDTKFNIDLLFFPLPNPEDFRIKASDEEEAALRQQLEDNIKQSYQTSMQSVWKRLYDVVSKAHERLSDPTARFHDTLVDNARDLCGLLPSLNIADDPNLEALRQELENSLCRHTADVLRQPGHTRSQTADKMADIMAKMGAFYTP